MKSYSTGHRKIDHHSLAGQAEGVAPDGWGHFGEKRACWSLWVFSIRFRFVGVLDTPVRVEGDDDVG